MSQSSHGIVLLDGALFDDSVTWLYQTFPSHQPLPLLTGTPYEAIADAGTILLEAWQGSPLQQAWWRGDERLADTTIWLETPLTAEQVFVHLQRRLRVQSPDHRSLWLRLGNGEALRHAWLAEAQWPTGFWHGVNSVWLHHQGTPRCAWSNEAPHLDCTDTGANEVTLDWLLLQALAQESDNPQEVG